MSELPLWVAIVIAILVIGGAVFTLVGTYGLMRFRGFYPRVHAPTLGTSLGMVGIALASILYFSITRSKPLVHEVLIMVFVTVTTPVTLMLLTRAALYRDRAERSQEVPWMRDVPDPQDTEL